MVLTTLREAPLAYSAAVVICSATARFLLASRSDPPDPFAPAQHSFPPLQPLAQEEVIKSSLAQRNIPPHHPEAQSAEEAYQADELVPVRGRGRGGCC